MSQAMNDEEVLTELKKMVAFIRQEAVEKAREIQVKADEDFAIEKAKIVQKETLSVDNQFEKKKRQVVQEQKIAKSNRCNKARLEVLKARQENLQTLFENAAEQLTQLTEDQAKYKTLLQDLVLQGLLDINEPEVQVTARSGDVQLVQGILDDATNKYKEATGRTTKVQVVDGLPQDSKGGVKLAGNGGKVWVNNTLELRLQLLEEFMLPELRMDLFGPNKERKFYT
ncbi:V-ATPase V1 sector subunit E [Malassezia vespertilionis]|uniref:Vma4p n=1 Tax=Malassezia vespertilionis TaxID=2020962 RepID=A0A2N1JCK4_9BASI|nr:V-ATPase V1 sector subunit E [Malassezia vespertilionis]PKI84290.1 Vma4p [Malassezia vespertilionis]WFD06391.1 V-ATPase V1 sector subunit E [Malassezia vespertilionis]